jgi:hypothetical protein
LETPSAAAASWMLISSLFLLIAQALIDFNDEDGHFVSGTLK